MAEDEVDLAVKRAFDGVSVDPTRGVEDLPLLGEAVPQRLEDLRLGAALDVLIQELAGIHVRHAAVLTAPGPETQASR